MALLLLPFGGPPSAAGCDRRCRVGAAGDAQVESLVVGQREVEAVVGGEVEAAAMPGVGHGGRRREVQHIAHAATDAAGYVTINFRQCFICSVTGPGWVG